MKGALLLLCLLALPTFAGEAKFEGVVSATITRAGTQQTHLVFTRKGDLLRIENADNKIEAINIIDLAVKKLTIIYPHNTTFVRVNLPVVAGGADPGRLASPPIPMPGSTPPATINKIGPAISPPPGFPTPPPMPSMPQMPNPGTAGPMQMGGANPMMPPPPIMMPGLGGVTELKKTEQSKKIQGLDSTLYTASSRGENFNLWVTDDAALFPFRLIERDYLGRRFGPQLLEETWPQLLRDKSLFPLEATLKMQPGDQERLSFKVDKIEKKTVEDEKLFQPPEKFIETQAPQF